jgi:hypothetical protein
MRMVKDILGQLRCGYGVDRGSEDKKGNHDQKYCKKMVEVTSSKRQGG